MRLAATPCEAWKATLGCGHTARLRRPPHPRRAGHRSREQGRGWRGPTACLAAPRPPPPQPCAGIRLRLRTSAGPATTSARQRGGRGRWRAARPCTPERREGSEGRTHRRGGRGRRLQRLALRAAQREIGERGRDREIEER
ncbi:hypothetical protein PVAP13_1KG269515 [Panicum virgatum]|uniref:Uncharacterized protein n=1 Tax=Panicum virgatum TaxID=38727 RepID=A0A8T0XFR5_PANVG|nr:hypothetical protein PVAP13_1KG269515 [Panicum virgatum]